MALSAGLEQLVDQVLAVGQTLGFARLAGTEALARAGSSCEVASQSRAR